VDDTIHAGGAPQRRGRDDGRGIDRWRGHPLARREVPNDHHRSASNGTVGRAARRTLSERESLRHVRKGVLQALQERGVDAHRLRSRHAVGRTTRRGGLRTGRSSRCTGRFGEDGTIQGRARVVDASRTPQRCYSASSIAIDSSPQIESGKARTSYARVAGAAAGTDWKRVVAELVTR